MNTLRLSRLKVKVKLSDLWKTTQAYAGSFEYLKCRRSVLVKLPFLNSSFPMNYILSDLGHFTAKQTTKWFWGTSSSHHSSPLTGETGPMYPGLLLWNTGCPPNTRYYNTIDPSDIYIKWSTITIVFMELFFYYNLERKESKEHLLYMGSLP